MLLWKGGGGHHPQLAAHSREGPCMNRIPNLLYSGLYSDSGGTCKKNNATLFSNHYLKLSPDVVNLFKEYCRILQGLLYKVALLPQFVHIPLCQYNTGNSVKCLPAMSLVVIGRLPLKVELRESALA